MKSNNPYSVLLVTSHCAMRLRVGSVSAEGRDRGVIRRMLYTWWLLGLTERAMVGTGAWATSRPDCMDRLTKYYSHLTGGWFLASKATWTLSGCMTIDNALLVNEWAQSRSQFSLLIKIRASWCLFLDMSPWCSSLQIIAAKEIWYIPEKVTGAQGTAPTLLLIHLSIKSPKFVILHTHYSFLSLLPHHLSSFCHFSSFFCKLWYYLSCDQLLLHVERKSLGVLYMTESIW